MTPLEIGNRLIQDLQSSLGVSKPVAAGIVGNLAHESGGFKDLQEKNPIVPGSKGGYGFAQWTGDRRKSFEGWAANNNLSPDSYEANAGYLIHELTNTPEKRVLNDLQDVQSAEDAARIFSDKFLRPGIPHTESRLKWANTFDDANNFQIAQGGNTMTDASPDMRPTNDFIEVELPDGVIAEFPSTMSNSEIEAVLQKQFPAPPEPNAVESTVNKATDALGGYIARQGGNLGETALGIAEDATQRFGNVAEGVKRQSRGEQTLPETLGQIAGDTIGLAGDTLGGLTVGAYELLPDVKYGIGEGASAVAKTLGKLPSMSGRTIGEDIPQELGQLMQKYQQLSPRTQANVSAIGNIASATPVAKALQIPGKVIKKTGGFIKKGARAVSEAIPSPKTITSAQLRQQAGQFYKIADDVGGVVKPNLTKDLNKVISKKVNEEGATLAASVRKPLRKIADPEGVIRQAQEVFKNQSGKPLTLEGFKTIDQTLGDLAYKASTPDDVSRKVLIMQKELRSMVDNISEKDLIGGKEGFEAYAKGRELWKKQAKIRDLENITNRAFATDRPPENLRRALRRHIAKMKEDGSIKSFTKDEIDAINKIAETSDFKEIARVMSSRLGSNIAFGSGRPDLAAGLAVLGQKSRGLADDAILNEMNNVYNLIGTGQAQKQPFINTLGQTATKPFESLGVNLERLYATPRRQQLGVLGTMREAQDRQQ